MSWTPRESEWESAPRCKFDGERACQASAAEDGLCLRHLPLSQRKAAIARILAAEVADHPKTPEVVDLRGLRIDDELWADLTEGLEAVALDTEGRRPIWLARATFEVPAFFYGWRFWGSLNLDDARFQQGANFYGAVFENDVSFSTARFMLPTEHTDDIMGAFSDSSAVFQDAIFKGSVDFNGAEFDDGALFYRARFDDQVDFQRTTFKGQASLEETKWLAPQRLFGQFLLGGELNLRRASFEGDLLLEVEGGNVNFEDTRFGASLTIRARSTALTLEHLDLTRPALVELAPDSRVDRHGSPIVGTAVDFSADPDEGMLPKILSLRDSNVLSLTIASADLRGCLFQDVRNIDRLSIEGHTLFAQAPKGRSYRRIVYEESAWRLTRTGRARTAMGRNVATLVAPVWRAAQPRERVTADIEVQPDQLARIYRGLRKSLEESKDYAGASDLYYGEMEMRLRASSTPIADRVIIAVYWALSGYGLRASRSLFALAGTLVLFSVLFSTVGFAANESFFEGLLHSARTAALFPQGDEIELTHAGQAFQIVLRVVGPTLIALSGLALRSRIKR